MSEHFRTVQIPAGPEGAFAALEAIHELFEDEQSVALIPADSASALEAVRIDAPLHTDEPTLILCTSGSTGSPRGVELTVTALGEAAALSAVALGSQSVWLAGLPVTSIGGLNPLIRSALAGTAPVIWDGIGGAYSFDAEDFSSFLRATVVSARKQKLTSAVSLVPTQVHRLAENDDALTALAELDFVLVGGGALNPALAATAEAAGVNLIRTYGSTETSGGICYNGMSFEGVTIECDADQRVSVYSPTLATCYRDGETISPTWKSSDRGSINDGQLKILGRIDDITKVAGHNVDLKRLEQQLETTEGISAVAVVAREDAEYGTVPVIAFVGDASEADVEQRSRQILEQLGIPLRVRRLDVMPMLASGKPDRVRISQL